jgi:phage tail-like protein
MSYRFATAAQWNSCLFEQADLDAATIGLRPFAPFSTSPQRFPSAGAHASAVTRAGDVVWRDDAGALHRLAACADVDEASPAPLPIARAERIVATWRGLWVAGGRVVSLYEDDTLARLLTVELPDDVVDIAGDGRGGIFALVERGGRAHAIPVDGAGQTGDDVAFQRIAHAAAFVYLRRAERFVVLANDHLYWFSAHGGERLFLFPVAAKRPCFAADTLGSDGSSRVFVAGADGAAFGGGAHVLSFDGDGNALGDIPLDARATGIAATRELLLVTESRGLLRFPRAESVPPGAGEVRGVVLTPMLQASDREDGRRWLRVEASAKLPAGSSIEIAYAATDEVEVRDRLAAIAADASSSPSQRIHKLRGEAGVWRTPIVVHGSDEHAGEPGRFVAPLFDVRERYLWVSVALSAAGGGKLPELPELTVLYPGRTLMENLPAIYQRAEAQPGSYLRSLVGVLETTTQDLDARIGSIGSRVHPSTAPAEWLDYVARWLGLPWDDALSLAQKQAIVRRTPELARGRGTRAGLESLLKALIPGTPRRFRLTDTTADFGFATIGSSTLPAMLSSFNRWRAELDAHAVLGQVHLPCPGQIDDGTGQLAGKIRVDVAASAEERAVWAPWLLALITEMVPLTVRVQLRWVGAQALRSDRLDGTLALESLPPPRLGSGAITSLARLPERAARLSGSGPDIGTRLR